MLLSLAKKTLSNKEKYFSKRNISVKLETELDKKELKEELESVKDEEDEELEKFILSIQKEELTDPLLKNTLTDEELNQLSRMKEEEIKNKKGYRKKLKKQNENEKKKEIKSISKIDEEEYIPRKLTKEEEEKIEKNGGRR